MASLGQQLGQRVRERRKALGLSQERLAEKIEIAASFLGRIERGVTMPSVPTLVRLAAELQTSSDVLLGLVTETEESEALDVEIGAMLDALTEGDVVKVTFEDAGRVAGLVPRALREKLQSSAQSINEARRRDLISLIQRARPRTLVVLTLVAESMEGVNSQTPGRARSK